ncbi:hypothetical protein [Haloplanus halophilus]|uniref:hypothetical protein n=1 Tax=Haloplanus halophilus TaxID=2949993 RepID=UPI00203BE409|nr:hypothetical protein [Haloplanus sp. GDY1]
MSDWKNYRGPAGMAPLAYRGGLRSDRYPPTQGPEFPDGWSMNEWITDFEETPFYEQYEDRVEQGRELTAIISDYYADRGTGKTTLAVKFARAFDRTDDGLTPDKVTNTPEEFTDAYVEKEKGAGLVFDEAEAGVNARKAMTNVNQELNEKVAMGRVGEKYSFYTLPDINQIDKEIRQMAHYWVLIRRRGRARVYKLENNPFQDETYTKPICDVTWGALPDDDPVFAELHEQKWSKLEDEEDKYVPQHEVDERVEKERKQARKEARNEFIRAVDARGLLNKKEIAEVVDLHRSTVSRIASGEVTVGD